MSIDPRHELPSLEVLAKMSLIADEIIETLGGFPILLGKTSSPYDPEAPIEPIREKVGCVTTRLRQDWN